MAELAEAITPDSPDGTKAIVMGVPNAPSFPAAGAVMASGSGLQTGAGTGVGGTLVAVGVGGTAVGGWVAVAVVLKASVLWAAGAVASSQAPYRWVQVTAKAPFAPRDGAGEPQEGGAGER